VLLLLRVRYPVFFFYVPQYEPPQIRQYSSRVTNFFFEFRIRIPVFESSKSAAVY
jgi:hypothetical protein